MSDLIDRLRAAAALPTGLYAEAADELATLRAELSATTAENMENCRLLGMSAERELSLRAELAMLRGKGEPVGAQWQDLDGTWRYPMNDKHLKDTADAGYPVRYLYTHPAPQDDARDAERYRWLRDKNNSLETRQYDAGIYNGPSCYQEVEGIRELKHGETLDAAIDAAILAAKVKP